MGTSSQGFGLVMLTALTIIIADALLKAAAQGGHPVHHPYVLAGVGLYGISALLWFAAMHHLGLTEGGLAYAMLTLLVLCAIDVLWFGLRFGLREAAGIAAALLAMVLMTRPD